MRKTENSSIILILQISYKYQFTNKICRGQTIYTYNIEANIMGTCCPEDPTDSPQPSPNPPNSKPNPLDPEIMQLREEI